MAKIKSIVRTPRDVMKEFADKIDSYDSFVIVAKYKNDDYYDVGRSYMADSEALASLEIAKSEIMAELISDNLE